MAPAITESALVDGTGLIAIRLTAVFVIAGSSWGQAVLARLA